MTPQRARAAACALLLLAAVTGARAQAPPSHSTPGRPAAAASRPAATPAHRAVPFRPGEVLTYDVSFATYLTAGVATMTVVNERPTGGASAYYIVAEGQPTGLVSMLYPIRYKLDTLLDARTLLPRRGSVVSQERHRHQTRVTRFDRAGERAEYETDTPGAAKRQISLAHGTQDALSALYVLRATPLRPGSRITMPVCDGGQMYRVQFRVGQVEPVTIGASSVPAFRVTPTIVDAKGDLVGRAMSLWISADARRVPLKLRAELTVGNLQFTLRQPAP